MRETRRTATIAFALFFSTLASAVEFTPDPPKPSKRPAGSPEVTVEAPEPEQEPAPRAGGQIEWAASLSEALKQAKRDNKPVMAYFFVTWQPWCKTFEEKTLGDSAVVALSRRFVCVRVDGKQFEETAKKYGVRGYPTVIFLNSAGEKVHQVKGFIPARPFELEMRPVAQGRNLEKEYEDLARSNPTDFRSLVLLGIGHVKHEKWDEAIRAYERALAAGPGMEAKETHEVVYALCQLYDYKKTPEKSLRLLLELLETESSDKVKVHELLGQTYLTLKQPDKAIEHFEAERELVEDENQKKFIDQMIEQIRRTEKK
ncbi:MAG: thioredoxin family protein [Candidatus Sumerlaeia bacterium]|nr:thioredoxin family protein [Candidatus Sumerlaeia bacterium]